MYWLNHQSGPPVSDEDIKEDILINTKLFALIAFWESVECVTHSLCHFWLNSDITDFLVKKLTPKFKH